MAKDRCNYNPHSPSPCNAPALPGMDTCWQHVESENEVICTLMKRIIELEDRLRSTQEEALIWRI